MMNAIDRTSSIGVVGLGAMGGSIARRLVELGYPVLVCDLDANRVAELVALGAEEVAELGQLSTRVDLVVTCVPESKDVQAVGSAASGLLSGDMAGTFWLEMSTIDPSVTRAMSDELIARGGVLVDAAIGGYPSDALTGGLRLMVGASDEVLAAVRPFLDDLSSSVVHCGEVGAGVSVKVVNNLLAQVTYMATCEALLFGQALGLDLTTMMQVFDLTDAKTGHLRYRVPEKVAKRNFDCEFSVKLANKDARIAMEAADQVGSPQLFGGILRQYQSAAVQADIGDMDVSAMLLMAERLAGREL